VTSNGAAFRNHREALDYLFDLTDYERMHRVTRATSIFGLARMNRALEHCGNPHLELRAVHIGGTKGKGSTAAMLASMLRRAGHRVGLYTSPHLLDVRERIQVDGEWIGEDDLTRLLNRLHPYLEAAQANGETYAPTFFETFTVMAFLHFLERGVHVAVVEVGLGGRLDATNVLQPEVCAITPISFDHTEKLGGTLGEIAGEKAGILKPRVPVVSGVQPPEAREVLRARAAELGAPLRVVGEDVTLRESGRGSFSVTTWRRELKGLSVPLAGRHQRRNAAVAVGLAEVLTERGIELTDDDIRDGLAAVQCAGRVQTVAREPEIIVDGAHNPASISALIEALGEPPPKRTIFVVGIAADKAIGPMLERLGSCGEEFVFTRTNNPRAADPAHLKEVLAEVAPGKAAHVAQTPAEALDLARGHAGPNDRICVTGSMYLAGDALARLQGGANSP